MNFHYDKKDESFTPKISIHGIPTMCVLEEKSVEIFSVMRRYRTRETDWVSQWVTLRTELTDVTLVSEDTYWGLYWQDSGDDI